MTENKIKKITETLYETREVVKYKTTDGKYHSNAHAATCPQ